MGAQLRSGVCQRCDKRVTMLYGTDVLRQHTQPRGAFPLQRLAHAAVVLARCWRGAGAVLARCWRSGAATLTRLRSVLAVEIPRNASMHITRTTIRRYTSGRALALCALPSVALCLPMPECHGPSAANHRHACITRSQAELWPSASCALHGFHMRFSLTWRALKDLLPQTVHHSVVHRVHPTAQAQPWHTSAVLTERGFDKTRTRAERQWRGIRLRGSLEPDPVTEVTGCDPAPRDFSTTPPHGESYRNRRHDPSVASPSDTERLPEWVTGAKE